jgi:hypothetical protein
MINGTLEPEDIRKAGKGTLIVFCILVMILAILIYKACDHIAANEKESDAILAKNDVFYLAYGQCLELVKHRVRYKTSFKTDDPKILENQKIFESTNEVYVAFSAQNSYGMTVRGTGHCLIAGNVMKLDYTDMEDGE